MLWMQVAAVEPPNLYTIDVCISTGGSRRAFISAVPVPRGLSIGTAVEYQWLILQTKLKAFNFRASLPEISHIEFRY